MKKIEDTERLERFLEGLKSVDDPGCQNFMVPGFLLNIAAGPEMRNAGSERDFYIDQVEKILNFSSSFSAIAQRDGTTYQSFIRCFSSLNGCAGTVLKQLAFLPFLKEKLKVGRIIFLPTSEIGQTNRKGNKGSPFSVHNPFNVDKSLADPFVPEISAIEQYKTLISACKLMGMSPGSILPLTTLSIDSPLFKEFPNLGYWWRAEAGELLFAQPSTPSSYLRVQDRAFSSMFTNPPNKEEVVFQETDSGAIYCSRNAGISLVNALPHPIAGDPNSYTWSDVASIRYSVELTTPPQGSLQTTVWDYDLPAFEIMPKVINWRRTSLGEEFFLIDVSASLPREVLRRAKDDDIYFIAEQLWDFDTRGNEISGVVGPLIFAVGANWSNPKHCISCFESVLIELSDSPFVSEFFAGASNHDTKPPPSSVVVAIWAATWLLPGASPFVYSGSEFGSMKLTNKEFGFTEAEMQSISNQELALFNDEVIDWNSTELDGSMLHHVCNLLKLRNSIIQRTKGEYLVEDIVNSGEHISFCLRCTYSREIMCHIYLNMSAEDIEIEMVDDISEIYCTSKSSGKLVCGNWISLPSKSTVIFSSNEICVN